MVWGCTSLPTYRSRITLSCSNLVQLSITCSTSIVMFGHFGKTSCSYFYSYFLYSPWSVRNSVRWQIDLSVPSTNPTFLIWDELVSPLFMFTLIPSSLPPSRTFLPLVDSNCLLRLVGWTLCGCASRSSPKLRNVANWLLRNYVRWQNVLRTFYQ